MRLPPLKYQAVSHQTQIPPPLCLLVGQAGIEPTDPGDCRALRLGCPICRRNISVRRRAQSLLRVIDFWPNSPRGLHREVVSAPFGSGSVGATPSLHYRCAAFGKSNVNSLGRTGWNRTSALQAWAFLAHDQLCCCPIFRRTVALPAGGLSLLSAGVLNPYKCAGVQTALVWQAGDPARRSMGRTSAWTATGMPRSDLTAQRCADFLYRIFTEPSRLSRKYTLV